MLLPRSLAALLCLPACALADLPSLEPEPGLHAQVERQGELYFLRQPDGSRIELSIPEGNDAEAPSFDVDDYNFDGHPDLAIRVPVGMVNSVYHLYLYHPALQRFEHLHMPVELLENANCSELSELHPNKDERALYSHCRSGPRWFYDAYRFDESGAPWRYKALQLRHDYSPDYPYVFFPIFERTFDQQGKVVASRALDDDDQSQTWTVPSSRLYLHERPNEASRTKAYLIQGDVCEVLDQQGRWLQIRYASRKGPLERWVSLDAAYDLHQGYNAAPHPDGLTLSMGDFSDPQDANFTLNLGPSIPTTLDQAEVHLLFTADDGTHYSHRLYSVNYSIEAREGEGELLDDNYIESRNGQFLIYHPDRQGNDGYVPFFPELPPARYRIRAVLTDPSLSTPVYSEQEVEMDYPPAIAEMQDDS